jgi:hypothetical protein
MSGVPALFVAIIALAVAIASVVPQRRRRRRAQPLPPVRRDPGYDPRRCIPKPGGSGGSMLYTGCCDAPEPREGEQR